MKTTLALAALGCSATLACGGKTGAHAPTTTARIDCPTEPALGELARPHLVVGGGELHVSCVALHHQGPRWLVVGWHEPDSGPVAQVSALFDATSGAVLWKDGVGAFDYERYAVERDSGGDWTAVDLDGDGDDEVIAIDGTMAEGYDVKVLRVRKLTNEGLASAGEIPFGESNGAAAPEPGQEISCHASWKVVPVDHGASRLELDVTNDGPVPAQSCLSPGRHVFTWTGDALVETP